MVATLARQGPKYAVDLAICIDGTASMSPVIEAVKSVALSFYEQLEKKMAEQKKKADQLRAKVIVFRDYWDDPESMAMNCSEFFDLPKEGLAFNEFVSSIYADGGGDEPENGLEALALAMNSDWERSQNYTRKRHITLVFSDASTHDLDKTPKPDHYPTDIPHTFDELTEFWDSKMSGNSKRLLLFTPELNHWSFIAETWENVIFFPSKAGQGLEGFEMDEILNAIVKSV